MPRPGAASTISRSRCDVVPYFQAHQLHRQPARKDPVTLYGHYWYNVDAAGGGPACPAIVELNPYRCRDGTMYIDSACYPWFAYNGLLCFRVDLQGSGYSTGSLTDEYTDEELRYCVQVSTRSRLCRSATAMSG